MARRKKNAPRTAKSVDEKYTGGEPVWQGWETWPVEQFMREQNRARMYYNYFRTGKEMKPQVIQWMKDNGYTRNEISAYRAAPDNLSTIVMGVSAVCLKNGMPARHPDADVYLETMPGLEIIGDQEALLRNQIAAVIKTGEEVMSARAEETPQVDNRGSKSVYQRVVEKTADVADAIDEWLESFAVAPESFDPKGFNVSAHYATNELTQAHARVMVEFYSGVATEIEEVIGLGKRGLTDMELQLAEGYALYTIPQLKRYLSALREIIGAATVIIESSKAQRKPRKKRAPSKSRQISGLTYMVTDDRYKLASINPADIIGASELWVFNVKSRKLGRYVVDPNVGSLSVKGTTIQGFAEKLSVHKTVRKPEETLAELRKTGKVQRRKFLDSINSVETRMTGRINKDTVLLRAE